MSNPNRRVAKSNPSDKAPASVPVLFLGSKVLDELRILMRLAMPNGDSPKVTSRRLAAS